MVALVTGHNKWHRFGHNDCHPARIRWLVSRLHTNPEGEPALVQTFETVEQLRQALLDFREIYNGTWLIERHGFQPSAALYAEPLPFVARAA
jgi:hypothetical protein